jgi:dihydroorotate dehydrogenase
LAKTKPHLPADFKVGVNIGKNKETPNGQAAEDYRRAASAFEGLADYLVINVSSPNTPGLRSLQTIEALEPITRAVSEVIAGWKPRPPLLLKIAPELGSEDLTTLLPAAEALGIDGWVLTNTLAAAKGGLSGGPLIDSARKSLRAARSLTRLPIISVGGILTVEEAQARLDAGADLIQIFTGWIYQGPTFPVEVAQRLRFPYN